MCRWESIKANDAEKDGQADKCVVQLNRMIECLSWRMLELLCLSLSSGAHYILHL